MAFKRGESGNEARQFKRGQSGNPKGRPPKTFSALAKEWKERGVERATPAVLQEAFEYILGLPLDDVKDIAGRIDDPENNLPMAVRLAAKELLGKRSVEIFKEMLDRAHGKSRQAVEHSGPGGTPMETKTIVINIPPDDGDDDE